MNPEVHHDNNGNDFVKSFVNQDMLADSTIILPQDILQANFTQRFGVNRASLQGFPVVPYGDEVHERATRYLNLRSLNASQIHYICHVLLLSELFDYYTTVRHLISVFLGPVETGKKQTIMSLISGTYCIIDDRKASAINLEALRRLLVDDNTRRRRNSNYHLPYTVC